MVFLKVFLLKINNHYNIIYKYLRRKQINKLNEIKEIIEGKLKINNLKRNELKKM